MHLDFYGGFFRFFSFEKKKAGKKRKHPTLPLDYAYGFAVRDWYKLFVRGQIIYENNTLYIAIRHGSFFFWLLFFFPQKEK